LSEVFGASCEQALPHRYRHVIDDRPPLGLVVNNGRSRGLSAGDTHGLHCQIVGTGRR
jgi:hypothetical protein